MPTAQQEKNGTFTGRARYKFDDLSRPGFQTRKQAVDWARDVEKGWKNNGAPKGEGPTRTSVSRALLEMALIQLPFKKGAPEEAKRMNQYLRLAGMPLLWVTDLKPDSGEASDPAEPVATAEPDVAEGLDSEADKAVERKAGALHCKVELVSAVEYDSRSQGAKGGCQRSDPQSESMGYRKVLGAMKMSDVRSQDVQRLIDLRLEEGSAVQTVLHDVAILRELFNNARIRWNWLPDKINPASKDCLRLPKFKNGRARILSPHQEERLAKALLQCYDNRKLLAVAWLAASAMRCEEALVTIRWGDVNLEEGLVHLREDKAGGGREVPLTNQAIAILRILKRGQPHESVFGTTYESLKAAFRRACERAGIEDLHLHDLRHWACTSLSILLNGDIPALKKFSGHETDVMVKRYVHITPRQARALVSGERLVPPGEKLIEMAIEAATANLALTPEELSKARRIGAQLRAPTKPGRPVGIPAAESNVVSLAAFRARAA